MQPSFKARQSGQSMTEFIIITPVMFLLVFGVLQFGLLYQAKTTLNYATFEAARAGALNNAQVIPMQNAFARAMAAMYYIDIDEASGIELGSQSKNVVRTAEARNRVRAEIRGDEDTDMPAMAEFVVINPNEDVFSNHGVNENGKCYIPNDNLMYRDSQVRGDVNIQDANLLKIRVTYCYPLHVPFVNKMLTSILLNMPDAMCPYCVGTFSSGDSIERTCLLHDRFPLNAQAIVRMQTPATMAESCP